MPRGQHKAVKAGFGFKPPEFEGIKTRVVELLPNTKKFNRIFLSLFIVCPHPNHFHRLDVIENLVHQAVLYVDSSGIGAGKISHKLLIWRGIPVRVFL
jgi:hypothetical protein